MKKAYMPPLLKYFSFLTCLVRFWSGNNF